MKLNMPLHQSASRLVIDNSLVATKAAEKTELLWDATYMI